MGYPAAGAIPAAETTAIVQALLEQWLAASKGTDVCHKGASAPDDPAAGMLWLDDHATPWTLKQYDGAAWATIGTLDPATHAWLIGVAQGGTGATTAAGARAALGVLAADGVDRLTITAAIQQLVLRAVSGGLAGGLANDGNALALPIGARKESGGWVCDNPAGTCLLLYLSPGSGLYLYAASGQTNGAAVTWNVANGVQIISAAGAWVGAGAGVITKAASHNNTPQAIVNGGSLTLGHGMGVRPTLTMAFIRCKTAEYGYAVGDEVAVLGNDGTYGINLYGDATNTKAKLVTNGLTVINTTTGAITAITPANWDLYVRAWA